MSSWAVSASFAKLSEPSEPSAEMIATPSSGSCDSALRNGSIVWTKIAFGFTAPKQCFSLAKSDDITEYAIEIGVAGAPMRWAASDISACSIELPDRISSGASGPSPRSSSACARARVMRAP